MDGSLSRAVPFVETIGGFDLQLTADDLETPLTGVPVLVSQAHMTLGGVTDADARFPQQTLDLAAPIHVTLGEASVPGGETVGQVFQHLPLLAAPFADDATLDYHQPLVRAIGLAPGVTEGDGIPSGSWSLSMPVTGGRANVLAGCLRAPGVIRAYHAFHGAPVGAPSGPAWLVRVGMPVSLPEGTVLKLDLDGFPGDQWTVGSTSYAAAGSSLSTTVLAVEPSRWLSIGLSGELAPGDHLIQATSGVGSALSVAGSVRYDASPVWLPLLPATADDEDDCDPQTPSSCGSPACTPSYPNPKGDCHGSPIAVGLPDVKGAPKPVGDKTCNDNGPGGGPISRSRCVTVAGGVVVEASINVGAGSFTYGRNGSVSGSDCISVDVLPGQCVRVWLCKAVKVQLWEVCECYGLFPAGCYFTTTLCVRAHMKTTACSFD